MAGKIKSISRVEQHSRRLYGWNVRLQFNMKKRSKFFSDRRHGGKAEALARAIEWRDSAERELGRPRSDRRIIGAPKVNSTGVVGVQRPKGRNTLVVHFPEEACRLTRVIVPIGEGGEKSALRRAARLRREMECKHLGSTITPNWEKALTVLAEN